MARMARGKGDAKGGKPVTDFPFTGKGVRSLAGKGKNEPKRTSNLRQADRHVAAVRKGAVKKAPVMASHGMLHGPDGPHPISHLGNDGAGSGQKSRVAEFRAAAAVK